MKIRVDRLKQIIQEELEEAMLAPSESPAPTTKLLGVADLNTELLNLTPADLDKVVKFAQTLANP